MVARRLILIFFVLLATSASMATAQTVRGRIGHHPRSAKRPAPRAVYVDICQSRRAYAYHSGMCRGLSRCTHGVGKVTVAQARNSGYVPCKICY